MAGTIVPASPLITRLEKQSLGYAQCSLSNFNNTSEPQIAGDFEIAGSIGVFASYDSITGWGTLGNGTVYIKVVPDTGAGTVAAQFTDVAPTWDPVKQGWYGTGANANHRYFFRLTKTGASGYEDKRRLNDTGDSAIAKYKTDQDLRTTDSASFASIDFGGGAMERVVLNIGAWDMDNDASVAVSHGLSDVTKIRGASCIIQNDLETTVYPLGQMLASTSSDGGSVGFSTISASQINLLRQTGGGFDSSSFSSTLINRGWVILDVLV